MKEENDRLHQVEALCTLGQQAQQGAFGPQRAIWIDRLKQHHAGLGEVLERLVLQGDAEQGLRLALLWDELWFEEQYTTEGRRWFERLLALPQSAELGVLRARALDLAGALALMQADYLAARTRIEEGLSLLRQVGTSVEVAYTLMHLGHLVGRAEGDFTAARLLYQEALELLQQARHSEGTNHAMANLAGVEILLGNYQAAQPLLGDSLRWYQENGSAYNLELSLRRAAGLLAGLGRPEQAMRLAGASARHRAELGVTEPAVFLEKDELMLRPARLALDKASQVALWKEGEAMTLEQAVGDALKALAEA